MRVAPHALIQQAGEARRRATGDAENASAAGAGEAASAAHSSVFATGARTLAGGGMRLLVSQKPTGAPRDL